MASGEHCCSCQYNGKGSTRCVRCSCANIENLALPAFPADQIAAVILTTLPTQIIHPPNMFSYQVLFSAISLPFVN